MVLLLADVFLLLTQALLWVLISIAGWFFLLRVLPKAILSTLVLLLILAVLALSFIQGPPSVDQGVLAILWRIISFPFTPLGLIILLLYVLLSGAKLAKMTRNIILGVLILLALGSVPAVAYLLNQETESEAIALIRPLPAAAASRVMVVLAQDTTRPQLRPATLGTPATPTTPQPDVRPISPEVYQVISRLPTQINDKADVLLYAAQLYREITPTPQIIVSAGRYADRRRKEGETDENASVAADARNLLVALGVPETSIRLDANSPTIRASAENVRELLRTQNITFDNQLILVAPALQASRAFLTFTRAFQERGTDVTVFTRPTDFYTLPPAERLARVAQGRDLVERSFQVIDIIPTSESFYQSSRVINEYLTSIYYFLRGWIRPLREGV